MHIRKRTALHATQCLPCTCTARGYHALVDLIPSTLRRNLRSLSEVPSTLRRNLRSIAVSFFLPCEHNNRKADRIAFLNFQNETLSNPPTPKRKLFVLKILLVTLDGPLMLTMFLSIFTRVVVRPLLRAEQTLRIQSCLTSFQRGVCCNGER